jgi:putative hydrolase of the HAD superfamily
MPRAILFDLYDTLVGPQLGQRREVSRSMGADLGVDPDRYADEFAASYPLRIVGALGDLESTVRAVAVRVGGTPSPASVRLAATRRIALTRELLWPSAATLTALDELRDNGWRLGLVSNCSAETPELWKRTPLASRFDAVGFSCELGLAKPDPGIYLAVCSFLAIAPTGCVFVGDGADGELAGAAALGMAVIRTEEFTVAEGNWPKQRIGALAELPALLGGVSGPPGRSPRSVAGG